MTSRPSRARGLKQFYERGVIIESRLRVHHGRVDWNSSFLISISMLVFASITGAWIETNAALAEIGAEFRVHHGRVDWNQVMVLRCKPKRFASITGAWIETLDKGIMQSLLASRPSRARGLKQIADRDLAFCGLFASITGAWIETRSSLFYSFLAPSRPSRARGLKLTNSGHLDCTRFASITGAWIETSYITSSVLENSSRPSRARGLKHRPIAKPLSP